MRNRLLVLAALGVLPLAQAEGQRSRAKKDSSMTAYQAIGAIAGLGASLFSVLGSGDEYSDGPGEWCVGSCSSGSRNGFGLFVNPASSRSNARGEVRSLLRASPERRAVLLETLDDALENAGLRLVGGNGRRVWFGTDGSDLAVNRYRANISAREGDVGSSFGGTGVGAGANAAGGTAPSSGCIIASCMLGEGSGGGSALAAGGTVGAALVLDGSPETMFNLAAPSGTVSALAGDVNVITNPEPGTIALMVAGLAGLALVRRRQRVTQ